MKPQDCSNLSIDRDFPFFVAIFYFRDWLASYFPFFLSAMYDLRNLGRPSATKLCFSMFLSYGCMSSIWIS